LVCERGRKEEVFFYYAERECNGAVDDEEESSGVIFAEARRITSSSAGAKISGGIPPTATKPGSSPSAIEIWFQRRKGDVVGSTMSRRLGSGKAKYADQMQSVMHIVSPLTMLNVEFMFE
jgi:hypothetical protein